ncbi:alpha/beta hydrolase [Tropicimonas sp. TH_r6]|uniref:alpha/beta fold hydrolase n=1 Tax=Tropicimonas sp. TH_r6 TaxID=3082085 RepID=UPI0029538496|nr:alpha/beta hydrolase [Tropicimonas sp. TH_r6]MDV7144408.1 alpha/beta hydrolase [Tropicimonas sp. TH_r6]
MRIILVHGAWGQAAGWGVVPELLSAAGHEVEAVDLPGHGADPTPPGAVTLGLYAEALATRLRSGPKAVLVGHSMGGMAISAAAELAPESIARLVYVAAFLPRDGDSLLSLKRREPETIGPAVRRGAERGTTELDPELARQVLFQDLGPAQQEAALALIGPQANAAQTEPVRLSTARFGRIGRDYILCRADRTVTPELQRLMSTETPCRRVVELESGHFPQLSMPEQLAAEILGILA